MEKLETGGILSGLAIKEMVEKGAVEIDPWDPSHVNFGDRLNPASYDLTLGPEIAVYSDVVVGEFDQIGPLSGPPGSNLRPYGIHQQAGIFSDRRYPEKKGYIDVQKKNPVKRYAMDEQGVILLPGIGYLMHTVERIRTDKFVPIIDGKSSIGRLFVAVHVTAGYGDPGFDGQYTLEVIVTHPTVVVPGMRFCQMRFHTLVGEVETYKKKGNYQGELATGPIESRSWRMFPQDER